MTVRLHLTAVKRRSTRRTRITTELTLTAPTMEEALKEALLLFRLKTGLTPAITILKE